MTIQLIGKDDSSFDDSEVLTGRWQAYIQSYISVSGDRELRILALLNRSRQSETTDGVSPTKVKHPYLRRFVTRSTFHAALC